MKEYKTVSGPQSVNVAGKEGISEAAQKYADFINNYAAEGWEYKSCSPLIVSKKGGCLRKDTTEEYKMMIFERDCSGENQTIVNVPTETSFVDRSDKNVIEQEPKSSKKKPIWLLIVLLVLLLGALICGFLFIFPKLPFNNRRKNNGQKPAQERSSSYFSYSKSDGGELQTVDVEYDALRNWYSEKIDVNNGESIFWLIIQPIKEEPDGEGVLVGEFYLEPLQNEEKPLNPGTYGLYVTVTKVAEKKEQIPDALRSITSEYGKIKLYDNFEELLQLYPKEIDLSGTYIGCTHNGDTQKFKEAYIIYPDKTYRLNTYEYNVNSLWQLCGGGPQYGTYSVDGDKIHFHNDDMQNGKYDITLYFRLDGDTLYLGETENDMIPYYKNDGDFQSLSGYTLYKITREENEITVSNKEFYSDGTFNEHSVDYSNTKYHPFPDAYADSYGWYVQPKGYPSSGGNYYSSEEDNSVIVLHYDYDAEWGEHVEEYDVLLLLYMDENTHTLITSDDIYYITRTAVKWESICPFFGVSLD